MPLHIQQRLHLLDREDRLLGQVTIEDIRGELVFGRFIEGPGFPQVEQLFSSYREAANQQLFSHVDELDNTIADLEARLDALDGTDVPAIHDVQIGMGRITFRLQALTQDGREQRGKVREVSAEEPMPGSSVVP